VRKTVAGILEGIRVLDFGHFIAGPFCAALLADLGADVVRVERLAGSDDRYLMPATADGVGALYLQANRNKRSLTLDYRADEGRAVMRRLIAGADIVVANFSTSALVHFGLDYPTLKSIKPDIILTTVGAFARGSEMAEAVGFDGVGQAVSGAIYLTGEVGQPYRASTSFVDFSTAISAAFGTLAAVIRRLRTGEGGEVESTLVGTALNIMNPVYIEQATGAYVREPIGNRVSFAAPSDLFRAQDGWFIMQVIGQAMFRRWADVVERPDLVSDPRFVDDTSRGRNGAALSAIMSAWAERRSREECLARLAACNVAASPVLTPADVVGGALGLDKAYFQPVDFGSAQAIPIVRPPVRVGNGEQKPPTRPPYLGEHSETVLSEYGFSADEIGQLRNKGLV
jgi:crotonobetainyl-CoA:carnitine CoA-transferase CaiB-like acyl-CoA transferase